MNSISLLVEQIVSGYLKQNKEIKSRAAAAA